MNTLKTFPIVTLEGYRTMGASCSLYYLYLTYIILYIATYISLYDLEICMDCTRRYYSCNCFNGSTRITWPHMTKIGLEDLIFAQIGLE